MSKLESLQNKAVKIIGGGTTRKSLTPFYGQLKILKLTDLYKFEIPKLVHVFYMTNYHPLSYFLIFSKDPSKFPIALPDPIQTKTNCIFLFSLYRTNSLQRSIKYQGVSVWNSIPMEIQNLPKHSFTVKPKEHLLQLYI